MPRKFISGSGVDTTATVMAFLRSTTTFAGANLYLIGEPDDSSAIWLTDWNSPLSWPWWGTFQPASISRDKVPTKIGLDVQSLNLTWAPPKGVFGLPGSILSSLSPYQLAQNGYYDNKKVRIWRTVMPTPGDADTYGACEWFGGWIAESTVQRGKINFKVDSFLSVLDQMVPPNVIESQNTLAGFVAGTPVLADGETNVPTFSVVAPSSATQINGDCIQPTAHKIYGKNKFQHGYMVFLPGSTLAGAFSAIGANVEFSPGGGLHYNGFTVYTPFPYDPTPGDKFLVATQYPVNLADAQAASVEADNFPYVPDPESSL